MPVAELRGVASGRVWTGAQAKERGLVDVLGNFEEAVTIAAQAADLGVDYKLRFYPVQKTFLEEWLGGMEENAETRMLKRELGTNYDTYQYLKKLKNYQGSQARMPYELVIE